MTTYPIETTDPAAFNNVLAANIPLLRARLAADESFLSARERMVELSLFYLEPVTTENVAARAFAAKEIWEKLERGFTTQLEARISSTFSDQINAALINRKRELDEGYSAALRTLDSWGDTVLQNARTQTTYDADLGETGKQPEWWNQNVGNQFYESMALMQLLRRKFTAQRERYSSLLNTFRRDFLS